MNLYSRFRDHFCALVLSPLSRWAVLPLLYFSLATAWMTWPMVGNLRHAVPGWPGDNLYYVWLIGWFQKALFTLHINPLVVPFHNYPYGWPLAYTEITLANVLPALPFSLIGGPAFGYNAVILLSFVLSGWFVFLWADALLHNPLAALVAGTIFAFAPYRLAHSPGHLPLMGTQWLALYFFGLTMLLIKQAWDWRYALAAGLGLGLAGLSSMYYLYMSLVVSALVVLGYLVFINRRELACGLFWKKLLAVGIIALPLMVAALAPYLSLAEQGSANHRPLAEVDGWSASLTDFFLPSPTHFLWGDWIKAHINRPLWVEQYIYLGVLPLLLIAAAFWPGRKNRGLSLRQAGWIAAVLVGAAVLAMGTTVHWLGKPVVVSHIPDFLKRSSLLAQGLIPLPNYFLYKYLPFYNGMRGWSRYGVYVILFGALLAGAGYARLAAKINRRGWAAALLLVTVLLICVDYRVDFSMTRVLPRPVDAWLRSAPGSGSVAQFPIAQSTSPEYVLGSLTHQKPLLGMFYGAYLPRSFTELTPKLAGFPDPQSIAILRQRQVSYVVVDASRYPRWTAEQVTAPAPGLILQQKVDQYLIYRLDAP